MKNIKKSQEGTVHVLLKVNILMALVLGFGYTLAASLQADDFVEAARSQIGRTLIYDPSYRSIDYPNGDIPADRGVCTDVIIRALRDANNYDLQKHVHEDMKSNFSKYPQIWGLSRPDKNIDHRRVPNLETFFQRQGWSLPLSKRVSDYQAGDIVTCIVPPRLPHIMVVGNHVGRNKTPLIIHNIGSGTQEEDLLFEFEMTGHFRIEF